MQLKRMFSTGSVKGTKNYLRTQKKYEVIRTIIYFAISISLFTAGYLQTGRRANLLSIVAVLGCLPASKSAVSAVMFLRFKSCKAQAAAEIEEHSQGLRCLYDMVFTSYRRNFVVSHLAVCGNTVCGYAERTDFAENEFNKHISEILKLDGHKNVTVKIFTSLPRYWERLEQMKELTAEVARTEAVIASLKSVAL
ncbi:hypothetical protein NSB25_21240 [Acetatifactor muris]|jgi:hypothetical protein|uniref:Uncharacterized protein n=1 Tax=Acetatifactor muris TaxID=879566 RepID=A0A2K4ZM42_9FIRM|nr:hypothetical protein [Acetatifactor muris]MCI8800220.1 hypothetical protein [Lachnospiraceae bacterium]MCR2049784.1 hypothetical protein [Acetatifactor muris]SOY31541.1 hypothetical protein AMURIS_04285 [Acetatifactor muris]